MVIVAAVLATAVDAAGDVHAVLLLSSWRWGRRRHRQRPGQGFLQALSSLLPLLMLLAMLLTLLLLDTYVLFCRRPGHRSRR